MSRIGLRGENQSRKAIKSLINSTLYAYNSYNVLIKCACQVAQNLILADRIIECALNGQIETYYKKD